MTTNNTDVGQKAPSIADEMAKFKGYSTNNGETVDPKATGKGPTEVNLTDDERAAGATLAGDEAPRGDEGKGGDNKAPPAKVTLTDSEASAALEKARTDLKLGDADELTKDEEDEALLAALNAKKEVVKPPVDRVKRAQEGRRRAEARAAAQERRANDLERRLAALESGGGKAPLTGDTKKANDAKSEDEPEPKDFEFGEVDPKYIRALARWEAKQVTAEAAKLQQDKTRTSQEERAQAEFAVRREAFEDAAREQFDDFQEIVLDTVGLPESDPAAWPLSALIRDMLFESDEGPAIMYQLASDPKEARRVNALSPAGQAAWFGRQEAKLSGDKPANRQSSADSKETEGAGRQESREASSRQVSRAPQPANRGRGAGGNKTVSAATTDFRAFEAMAAQPARR